MNMVRDLRHDIKLRRSIMTTKNKASHNMPEVADTNLEPRAIPLNEPVPAANDPGGAHAKGYSTDTELDPNAKTNAEEPVPLAPAPEGSHVCQPERDGNVRPTGRSKPRAYTPNDRLMGSDR
jgi:hypothetical protein